MMSKKNFYRRKIIIQILIPTITSFILLYIGYLLSVSHVKKLLLDERKNQVKEMVNSIYNLVEGYYKQVEKGNISKSKAQSILIVNIENLKYGENLKDYYWLIDYNNKMLAHPFYIDSITLNNTNPKFWETMTSIVTLAKEKGEGYFEYEWQWKDDTTRIENKISYVKGFEPWKWVMGTGFYTKDVDNEIKELTQNIVIIMSIVIITISLLFFIILRRTFKNHKLFLEKEDELEQSLKLFRGMATDSGLIIKENEKIIYANEKASEVFETNVENSKTFLLSNFVISEEKERTKLFFKEIQDKIKGVDFSFWIQTQKKNKKYINAKIAFKHLKHSSYTYILVTDNTEKKEIENKIEILSQMVSQSPDSMAITNLQANLIYVNKKFCEETGYTSDEVIGKNPSILKSGKMSPEIYKDMWKTITEGRVWQNELLNRKKNGELFWEDTIIFPIKNKNGEIIFYSAIKNNLTKQKQLEKELRQSIKEAKKSEKIKTAFLNNVSHEVNTPLNAIYGFADVLRSRFDKSESEYEQVNYIFKHAKILIKLFNDIMKYSAFESGDIIIKREEIQLLKMLEKLTSKYSVKIISEYQKDIEIIIDIKNDFKNAILISDREWITKIFDELITNSIKYTIEGTITLGYEINYEEITFIIKDTGVGIPDSQKESVMDSFTHGGNLYIGLHKGTGLGLNIIKSLVKHLGGKMWFTSKEGEGTTFFLSLPSTDVKNYTINNKKVELLPYAGLLSEKRIIIAEDNDNSFNYLRSLFIKEVKEIARVMNESELADLLKNESSAYDLILYDTTIPKLNNLSTLQTIKSSFQTIPIVAMVSDERIITLNSNKNYDAIIGKPFSKNKIYKILKDIL